MGGSYRWDLGERVGPAETTGRRPFSLGERVSPDEGIERRPIIRRGVQPLQSAPPAVIVAPGGGDVAPAGRVDSIAAAGQAVRRCFIVPPGAEGARAVTLRAAFRRDGSLIGEARMSASTPPAAAPGQAAFIAAARRAVATCAPLEVTARFGSSMAGRPITLRFVVERDL